MSSTPRCVNYRCFMYRFSNLGSLDFWNEILVKKILLTKIFYSYSTRFHENLMKFYDFYWILHQFMHDQSMNSLIALKHLMNTIRISKFDVDNKLTVSITSFTHLLADSSILAVRTNFSIFPCSQS